MQTDLLRSHAKFRPAKQFRIPCEMLRFQRRVETISDRAGCLLLRQLNMSGFVIPAEAGIQGRLMPPYRGTGQAYHVRHDSLGIFSCRSNNTQHSEPARTDFQVDRPAGSARSGPRPACTSSPSNERQPSSARSHLGWNRHGPSASAVPEGGSGGAVVGPAAVFEVGRRCQEHERVGVQRAVEQLVGRRGLHDLPPVHHGHVVAEVPHHVQVVGNEEVGRAPGAPAGPSAG